MYESPETKVLGATVASVTHDRNAIVITTDKGRLVMSAEGDCCSTSWFESVDVDNVAGATVTAFESAAGPALTPEEERGHDCLKNYFGMVTTSKGRILWEMRNSSNGYYGGYITYQWTPACLLENP